VLGGPTVGDVCLSARPDGSLWLPAGSPTPGRMPAWHLRSTALTPWRRGRLIAWHQAGCDPAGGHLTVVRPCDICLLEPRAGVMGQRTRVRVWLRRGLGHLKTGGDCVPELAVMAALGSRGLLRVL